MCDSTKAQHYAPPPLPPPPSLYAVTCRNQAQSQTNAYSADLLTIAKYVNPSPPPLPPAICNITTPLSLASWEAQLSKHPDPAFTHYIIDGITHGFRLGYNHIAHMCTRASSNHPSAQEHPAVISKALESEVEKGRLIGPLHMADFPYVQVSSLGAVPKKHTDKFRLILDLSHPKGQSVNDGIARADCSLSYIKVDDIVQKVLELGPGSLLAKIDIESAFRNVPVHPHDRHLLGMVWGNKLYIDTVLPFGLRSAPKIFNAIADALEWIAKSCGVTYLEHFLDDYVTVGAPGTSECDQNLTLLIKTCHTLNLPLANHKKEGPTTCLTFLGIELDTMSLELRLPTQKLARLKVLLKKWIHLKCCKKRDLESLVGCLHDASAVIRSGRTFIRRLIDLLKSSYRRSAHSFIRMNTEARSDIMWWHSFIEHWNGLSMMHDSRRSSPEVILTSDALGSWGCGAYWNTRWLQYHWSPDTADSNITIKELIPIVLAAAIWGYEWENKAIQCRCDNGAVVSIINSGTSKDPRVMGLMRCLHFISAKFNLLLSAIHLAGSDNAIADAISRNNLPYVFLHFPQANSSPCPIPPALLDLLIHHKPDWTSPHWNKMFNTTFNQLCLPTPSAHTHQAPEGSLTSAPVRHATLPSLRIHPMPIRRSPWETESQAPNNQVLSRRHTIQPNHADKPRPFHQRYAQAQVRPARD